MSTPEAALAEALHSEFDDDLCIVGEGEAREHLMKDSWWVRKAAAILAAMPGWRLVPADAALDGLVVQAEKAIPTVRHWNRDAVKPLSDALATAKEAE